MRGIEIELGAKNQIKRNIWFISLFIADKTEDTSKTLLEVRNSQHKFHKKASGMESYFDKAVSLQLIKKGLHHWSFPVHILISIYLLFVSFQ